MPRGVPFHAFVKKPFVSINQKKKNCKRNSMEIQDPSTSLGNLRSKYHGHVTSSWRLYIKWYAKHWTCMIHLPIPTWMVDFHFTNLVRVFSPTHLKNMPVKLDHFPRVPGENKTYLEPPPSTIGGRWYIIYNHPIGSIYHLYVARLGDYISPNHLLREPETAIDCYFFGAKGIKGTSTKHGCRNDLFNAQRSGSGVPFGCSYREANGSWLAKSCVVFCLMGFWS